MPGRRRRNLPLLVVFALIAMALVIYILVIPSVQSFIDHLEALRAKPRIPIEALAERIRTAAVEAITAVWFFALGASFGSFLNVIVYRMPAGKSITGSSRCPFCAVDIKFRDNIPVFGWLMLRGRCRVCRLPISARYPIVELVAGTFFVLVLFVETLTGGANLPFGSRYPFFHGFLGIMFEFKPDMFRLYAYHTFFLWMLFGFALIKLDGNRLPIMLVILTAVVGLTVPLIWEDMAWNIHRNNYHEVFSIGERLKISGIGLVVGVFTGAVVSMILNWQRRPRSRQTYPATVITLGLVGLYLGWQASLSVAMLAMIIQVPMTVAARTRDWAKHTPFLMVLFAATVLHLCIWRMLSIADWWPSGEVFVAPTIVFYVGLVCLALTTRLLTPPEVLPSADDSIPTAIESLEVMPQEQES